MVLNIDSIVREEAFPLRNTTRPVSSGQTSVNIVVADYRTPGNRLHVCRLAKSAPHTNVIRTSMVALAILTHISSCLAQPRDRFSEIRRRMVAEVIEAEGITNPLVLAAVRNVPRHEFVSGTLRARAYQDTALPIGSQQTRT